MTSGYSFKKEISLGNIIQVAVLIVGMTGGYFVVIGDIETNRRQIVRLEKTVDQNSNFTRKIDVIENELGHIASTLDRLEEKLDD